MWPRSERRLCQLLRSQYKKTRCISSTYRYKLKANRYGVPASQTSSRVRKARQPIPDEASDDEQVQDENDHVNSVEESDDSGSEYQASEDEVAPNGHNAYEDDDASEVEEQAMLQAAIQDSLDTARFNESRNVGMSSAGAGSSKTRLPVDSDTALRAAAAAVAERRLANDREQSHDNTDVDDSDALSLSSDDVPMAGKGASKMLQNLIKDTSKTDSTSWAQTQKRRREQRRQARLEKSQIGQEEARLRYKLGRKLTYVCSNWL